MAPCSSTGLQLSSREKKLRKPAVEKMRRDRVNSSIEQLRILLQEEFHRADPNGKLEKADVLELTVSFLKQRLQPRAAGSQRAHSEGRSQCWGNTLRFLSTSSEREVPIQQLCRFHDARRDSQEFHPKSPAFLKHSPIPAKQDTPTQMAIWRPW
ncbi:hypothetical protein SKAU_G00158830 [Synaphobranchus kaupii]|uniref:Transcription factor HES-5 n=1 Tax=Synaphobranchus kaupii TaxID=118154 RepID=A0A9Q1IZ70_SYNKA|nr:hypothetical protein SKAU_G00158830 [Synaphobranchus kaupii]